MEKARVITEMIDGVREGRSDGFVNAVSSMIYNWERNVEIEFLNVDGTQG
jgi:hypothetical protein